MKSRISKDDIFIIIIIIFIIIGLFMPTVIFSIKEQNLYKQSSTADIAGASAMTLKDIKEDKDLMMKLYAISDIKLLTIPRKSYASYTSKEQLDYIFNRELARFMETGLLDGIGNVLTYAKREKTLVVADAFGVQFGFWDYKASNTNGDSIRAILDDKTGKILRISTYNVEEVPLEEKNDMYDKKYTMLMNCAEYARKFAEYLNFEILYNESYTYSIHDETMSMEFKNCMFYMTIGDEKYDISCHFEPTEYTISNILKEDERYEYNDSFVSSDIEKP